MLVPSEVADHARDLRSEVLTELLLTAIAIADDLLVTTVLARCLVVQPTDLLLVFLRDSVHAANAGAVASIVVEVSVLVEVILVLVLWHDVLDVLPWVIDWGLWLWCWCGRGVLLVVVEVDTVGVVLLADRGLRRTAPDSSRVGRTPFVMECVSRVCWLLVRGTLPRVSRLRLSRLVSYAPVERVSCIGRLLINRALPRVGRAKVIL